MKEAKVKCVRSSRSFRSFIDLIFHEDSDGLFLYMFVGVEMDVAGETWATDVDEKIGPRDWKASESEPKCQKALE